MQLSEFESIVTIMYFIGPEPIHKKGDSTRECMHADHPVRLTARHA